MRPIWSGMISFGLINIPVKMYSASHEKKMEFNYLRRQDLCPIKYVKVCRNTGEEVPMGDVVRGYQYQKGDYVILQDEDFKRAGAKRTQTIEVVGFIDAKEIDPIYLEKPYYLEPVKEAQKAYVLLREALARSGKVGMAKFVLKTKEHLAMIKPEGHIIILDQMRFYDELSDISNINAPQVEADKREIDMAIRLIDQLTMHFDPEEFHNTYSDQLKKIIQDKLKGRPYKLEKEKVIPTETPDIMAKLRESLEKVRAGQRKY